MNIINSKGMACNILNPLPTPLLPTLLLIVSSLPVGNIHTKLTALASFFARFSCVEANIKIICGDRNVRDTDNLQ